MKLLFINQSTFLVPFKLWMEAYLRTEYNWQLSNKTFFLDYFPHYFVTSLKIKILETVLSRYLVNCIAGFSSIYQSKTFKNELPLAIFTRFDQTRSFFAHHPRLDSKFSISFFPNSNVFLPNLTVELFFGDRLIVRHCRAPIMLQFSSLNKIQLPELLTANLTFTETPQNVTKPITEILFFLNRIYCT